MSFLSYYRVETLRLFRAKTTWLVIALTLAAPLLGYSVLTRTYSETRAAQLIANPVLAGALVGTVLWALLSLYELDRVHKAGSAVLTDAIVSPLALGAAKLGALLTAGLAAGLTALLVYLPYTAVQMGNIFDLRDYLSLYLVVFTAALWIGILWAAIFYQITRRMDVSFILFAACALLSLSAYFSDNYILRWINPIIPTLSDDFSNAWPLRLAAYNRLFWLLLLSGFYLLSVLCIRRYGKGLPGSFARNIRKAPVPILAAALLFGSVAAYAGQPYVNHAPRDVWTHDCAYNENASLLSTHVESTPDIRRGTQSGTATYLVKNNNEVPYTQRAFIRCGYTVTSLLINGEPASYIDLNDDLMWGKHIEFEVPPVQDVEIVMTYGGMPRLKKGGEGAMFIGAEEAERRYVSFSAEGLAPYLELDPPEGESHRTTADVALPGYMTPLVARGSAEFLKEQADGTRLWRFETQRNRLSFYAADYVCQRVPLLDQYVEFYYNRTHEEVMERSNISDVLQETMLYGLQNIGVPEWFAGWDTLKLVQTTSFDSGGGAVAGMSTMYENAFSEDTLADPFRGASAAEVMAHEILHQWWGLGRMFSDMVNPEEETGWSSEGLTVYSTYRLMKAKHGEAYARQYYVDIWQQQVDAMERDFYNRHPEYLDILPERYAAGIQSGIDGTLRYCQMPLQILKAEELVGGEEEMDAILQSLFANEEVLIPPYLSYQDFLDACGLTKEDIAL